MASKRMFSEKIVCSDAFMEIPTSTQALYFHLGMKVDDDGFVNPKMIMRMIGANDDELKVLIAKKFVIPFKNGVLVLKHHRINNNLDKHNHVPTVYTEELKTLYLKENKAYTQDESQGNSIQSVGSLETVGKKSLDEMRLDKIRIDKNNIEHSVAIAPKENDWRSQEWADEKVEKLFEATKGVIDKKYLQLEIIKFKNYWTEKNPGGKKERWEMQKVFDPSRRLGTWFRNFLERNHGNKMKLESKYIVGEI